MQEEPILNVRNVSKRYAIGEFDANSRISEKITQLVTHPIKTMGRHHKKEFLALNDVSFSVDKGEMFGIIGKNGAGKSTILKIISKITQPSSGEIVLRGKVGSLLEVGTGFHQELTGRENIYMNGAILGLKKKQIDSKMDEIIKFSELENFIDTPVKRYSSGMYVRLAFSVAVQMETEILLMDEVLAVGDGAFQSKCRKKMKEISEDGRTILFVSHDMNSMARLCQRGIFLESGQIKARGEINEVIDVYMQSAYVPSGEIKFAWNEAPGDENVRIMALRVSSLDKIFDEAAIDQDIKVEMDLMNRLPENEIWYSFWVHDKDMTPIFSTMNGPSATLGYDGWHGKPLPVGIYRTGFTIPKNFLNEGKYHISAFVLNKQDKVVAKIDSGLSFHVKETGEMRKEYHGGWLGMIRPKFEWETTKID